ncbi:MAG: MBL fold metallo-hydrolase [Pseudomonadota bacterium]|nr:MBL fold metallo-hydrolase [Pseudomonadota bacterium]
MKAEPIIHFYPDGIFGVDCRFMRQGMACAHVLIESGRALVVDVGTAYSVDEIVLALKQAQIPLEKVDYVLLTHIHLDHASGAGKFMRLAPEARLVLHPLGARHMVNPSRLIEATIEIYGSEKIEAHYGPIIPVEASRIIHAPDGFELDFHGRKLKFLDTPGHARHHCSIVDASSQSIFAGDTFGVSFREFDTDFGPFIFPTTSPAHFDLEAAHTSIDRLMGHNPKYFYLMHYSRIPATSHLAQQMHEFLDAFAELALQVPGSGKRREQVLYEELMQFLLTRLQKHGSKLEKARMLQLLEGDVRLNAQGLLVWVDAGKSHVLS